MGSATTPGDRDRGRELAERALNLAESILNHGVDPGLTDGVVRDMRREIEGQRQDLALAAPAETEAGDDEGPAEVVDGQGRTWTRTDRGAYERRTDEGHVHTLYTVGGIGQRYGLAATPPAPEGEAGNLVRVSCGEHVATWVHEDEADEQPCPWCAARDATAAMDRANTRLVERTSAPAGPQAEGAGETAGGTS